MIVQLLLIHQTLLKPLLLLVQLLVVPSNQTHYNICAASAGTYCWGNGKDSSGSPSSDPKSGTPYDIDGDICPKGWRMPTGDSSGEYQTLYTAYSSNNVTRNL